MKMYHDITVSGGCKTFTGPEKIEVFFGTYKEAQKRRDKLTKETGRIMYLSVTTPQPIKPAP